MRRSIVIARSRAPFARELVARAFASTVPATTRATTRDATTAAASMSRPMMMMNDASTPSFARRGVSSDARAREDALNDLFVEAREEIENAMESVGSTYFNEDAEHARDATRAATEAYEALLASLPDDDARGAMKRSMGMKFEQLRGELAALDSAHDDH